MQFCGGNTRNPGGKYIHVSQQSTRLEKKLRYFLGRFLNLPPGRLICNKDGE
jgi:hypothetical protein